MIAGKLRQMFHRFRGRQIEFDLTPYRKLFAQIEMRADEFGRFSDTRLRRLSAELIAQARTGVALDDLLAEAYALAREVSSRVLGMRHFDVQVLGGIAMHQGKLVEMQTGEGKTLAAVLPAYLNALTGQGVHVLTFNDYLARRDAAWMGPVYEFLGLSVGFIQQGMAPLERRRAYRCDITYATAKEAGFDFLRDQLCTDTEDLVHRPFRFAIVDEADSILIDEARIPLVIAGSTDEVVADPYHMAELVRELRVRLDYDTDENERNVYLTESGVDRAESALGCDNLHAPENTLLVTQLHQALHAHVLLRRDVDYIVREGKVEIVDEFTGRVVEDRHWPHGLQAAVEAKEGLRIQAEGFIRGSITLIHLARMYPKLCGMTATAQAAAEEFSEFYGLPVVVVPPHRPCIRVDASDMVFATKHAKRTALVEEIATVRATGRPILVGTCSVAESEELAEALGRRGVSGRVLNAKNDELEAEIVAEAGAPGAVTISTNMAGRGTDIRLGGTTEEYREAVVALGGLYVIGTNRHESRRVDDQLRGRAARQGDPGSSRFFISLQDDLFQRFGIDETVCSAYDGHDDEPVDDADVSREIEHVQRVIEGQNLEIRKTLWQYSYVVDQQRRIVRGRRLEMLLGRTETSLLAERAPQRYAQLLSDVGADVLADVERRITLFHLDRSWAEHLDHLAHIRDGVHFITGGGRNPLDEYHRIAGRAFYDLLKNIDDRIVETFVTAEIGADGIDMAKEGLKGPSSTWTYLINDHPFGNWFERFYRTAANSGELFRTLKRTLADKVQGIDN
ncbi:MAG: accessory Sec system translocase SecA2 [Sedimentisphaerales bacterium]|nr:accessory Sec system translocase SecA2 [Sedimentisphaerales bacterium]